MTLTIGDKVQWTSQAGGYETTKTGEVVFAIPSGHRVRYYANQLPRDWDYSPLDGTTLRSHESFLVLVRPQKGKAKPRLYWPRVSGLKKVEGMENG